MTAPDCCRAGDAATPDLAVIGAGSAGFAAAIRGAELGARVALIGHGVIGGTCVNTGCVPSKTLLRAAAALHGGRAASRFAGIEGAVTLRDWSALATQKDALVAGLRQSRYVDVLKAYGDHVAYREGRAQIGGNEISVAGERITPGKIIIATGASPRLPGIPGLDAVPWTDSASALAFDRLPASLLVIGGGFVGCELGQMFARAGVAVTIFCRSRLLPRAEPEIGEMLARYLRGEGIGVRCGVAYEKIERSASGIELALREADGEETMITAERVLVAAGRRPNTEGLGLADAGIEVNGRGAIQVDDWLRTTRPGVYAAGDVTGRDMFVYMAAYGGKIAAENALNGDGRRYDNAAMPEVVFTDPQMATVGLTEAAAGAAGFAARTSLIGLDQVPRALAARDTRGLVKLVAERESGRLIGAHLLAPEAGDSIQTAALAIKAGMTVADLAGMVFPYLTTVEALKIAALGFSKNVAMLSCCAG
jgi:mercury(II) reductase